MNPGLLECVDLWASYGGARALCGVSFSPSYGEAVGIYGPNKAGKSSLARCIAGAKLADRGTIRWRGRDITRCSPAERLSLGISLCPEGRGIYSGMSVRDNLRLGADGLPAGEVKMRLDLILSYFPLLAARLGQRAGTLSGGEAQMLGVARRLMRLVGIPGTRAIQEPRLLIIDEPSLGLAPEFTQRVLETVSRIRHDHGVTIVLIEEVPSRLMGWVDRACVLNRGVIIAEGRLQELSQDAIVNEALGGGVEIDRADSPPGDGSSLDLD